MRFTHNMLYDIPESGSGTVCGIAAEGSERDRGEPEGVGAVEMVDCEGFCAPRESVRVAPRAVASRTTRKEIVGFERGGLHFG